MVRQTPGPALGHAGRRLRDALVGGGLVLLLVPFSFRVAGKLETAVHIRGGEAEAVDLELAERFQSPYAHRAVLVVRGLGDPDSPSGASVWVFWRVRCVRCLE